MGARLIRWPASLAGRTALVLLVSLALIQVAGLTIHALDRIDVLRLAQVRDVTMRAISLYRAVTLSRPENRAVVVKKFDDRDDTEARIDADPPAPGLPPADAELMRQVRADLDLVPMPPTEQPRESVWFGGPGEGRMVVGFRLPDGQWLRMSVQMPPPRPWHSAHFLAAFVLMTAAAAALTLWAVRRLIAPVALLAAAAERLGRDVNTAPLPETGPEEISTAAIAFNTMAARIRRLLSDRNFMLAAISHDLRTPITRLKLRAEFMEDDEQRRKMLADLDELEAMVAATLAVGRDTSSDEPPRRLDLAELVRTVLDETADARPDAAEALSFDGPDHLTVQARPVALKRALTNLVNNAVKYGGCAHARLLPPDGAQVVLMIEDSGPGIPVAEIERLFQPFQRLEVSRNRETGGVGLGLTIARNILRAHGGEVTIGNRPQGGARVQVTLPA